MEPSAFRSRTRRAGHIQTSGRQLNNNNIMPTDVSASLIKQDSKYGELFHAQSSKPKNMILNENLQEKNARDIRAGENNQKKNVIRNSLDKLDHNPEEETDDDSEDEHAERDNKIEVHPISSKEIKQESTENNYESKYFDLISKDMIEFVRTAPFDDELIKCKVFAKKSIFKEYEFCLEYPNGSHLLLMRARRKKTNLSVHYWIEVCYYTNPATFCRFGRLSSNISRMSFILIGDMIQTNSHDSDETSTKKYLDLDYINKLISTPKPKNINVEILLPSFLNEKKETVTNDTVDKLFKKSISKRMNFTTKKPIYDEASKKFKLDFKGRALIASSNNLQLIDSNNNVIFQLGKYKKKFFNCDFKHPLNAFQAFGIAICCLSRS